MESATQPETQTQSTAQAHIQTDRLTGTPANPHADTHTGTLRDTQNKATDRHRHYTEIHRHTGTKAHNTQSPQTYIH